MLKNLLSALSNQELFRVGLYKNSCEEKKIIKFSNNFEFSFLNKLDPFWKSQIKAIKPYYLSMQWNLPNPHPPIIVEFH